ncbi:MAG: Lrp/AsnC family transcriptional regulator [archaeon]
MDTDRHTDVEETDRAILEVLLEDGRATVDEVADEVGVVEETARRRIDRLESSGVIEGYTAVLDDDALGYDVTAIVRLSVVGHSIEDAIETLGNVPWARTVYEVTGEDDLLLVGTFPDTDALHETVAQLVTEPMVRSATVDVVLDTVRPSRSVSLASPRD